MRRELDDELEQPRPTVGSAEVGPPEVTVHDPVLWVPDPEQRHFWREHYVRLPKPGRPIGFRKPGER